MGAMGFLGKIFRGDTIPDSDYAEEEQQQAMEEDLDDFSAAEPFGTNTGKRPAPEKVVPFSKAGAAHTATQSRSAPSFPTSPFAAATPPEPPVSDVLRSGSFGESGRPGQGAPGGKGSGSGSGAGFPDTGDAYVVFKRLQDFQTASAVADRLIENKIVILNLENCDAEVARRVMDFIGGVAYACSSMVRRIAGRVFMITPKGVNSDGEFFDETRGGTEIRYDD